MIKVTAQVTVRHGSLLPADVVLPFEYEIERFEDALTKLFETVLWQSFQVADLPLKPVAIKFSFDYGTKPIP